MRDVRKSYLVGKNFGVCLLVAIGDSILIKY